MRHGALGISFGNVEKFLFRLLVPERMQQCDSALERLLHRRRTGDWKMNRAQLSFGEVFVMMVVFVFLVVGKRGELTQAEQQEQTCDFLHWNPPRAATRILVMLESRVKRPCGRSR